MLQVFFLFLFFWSTARRRRLNCLVLPFFVCNARLSLIRRFTSFRVSNDNMTIVKTWVWSQSPFNWLSLWWTVFLDSKAVCGWGDCVWANMSSKSLSWSDALSFPRTVISSHFSGADISNHSSLPSAFVRLNFGVVFHRRYPHSVYHNERHETVAHASVFDGHWDQTTEHVNRATIPVVEWSAANAMCVCCRSYMVVLCRVATTMNEVFMRCVNDYEVLGLVKWTEQDGGVDARFIKDMSFDGNRWAHGKLLSYEAAFRRFLGHLGGWKIKMSGWCHVIRPSITGCNGRNGFISSMTEHARHKYIMFPVVQTFQ